MSGTFHRALFLREIGIDPEWLPRAPGGDAGVAGRASGMCAEAPAPEAPGLDALAVVAPAAGLPPKARVAPVDAPSTLGVEATLEWEPLRDMVAGCTRCQLCEARTQTVFGVGDPQADWLLIGEAPGENEDLEGEPFVGQSGKLLDNMLKSIGLRRGHKVYIANVVKCRPPGNRDPRPDEVAACEPYLLRQIDLIRPKLIIVMGRFAAQTILRSEARIGQLRGRVHAYAGVPVIVTYHPAYLLRTLTEKARAWEDLCLAMDTMAAPNDPPSA